jgi:hypothetical protein
MATTAFVLQAVLGLGALAIVATPAGAAGADPAVRRDLEAMAKRRVFFGHQSVGDNILDGMRRLAAAEGVPLQIVEVEDASSVPPGALGHARVAHNTRPDLKLESFSRALGSGGPADPDVALVKLCFVDIGPDTDAVGLFARYRAALESLRQRHPRTTFVHVTVPLTVVQGGVKASLKRLLGRPVYGVAENARREQYNALLREAYGGRQPVFDVAAMESTRPDGGRETFELDGRQVPALVPAYSDDGGHLNGPAAERVARALAALLATLPASGSAPR